MTWCSARLAGLQERQAVVARVDVEEHGAERVVRVVAHAEAEHVPVERHDAVDVRGAQHHVPHAQDAGAETVQRARRLERLGRVGQPMEQLEAIAEGIGEP